MPQRIGGTPPNMEVCMIWLWDLIFVFIIACIVFGAIYAMAVRPTYSARAAAADDTAADIGCLWLVFLFFLFFLPIWGGGLWLEPIGPAINGSHAFNFILFAVIIFFFFAVIWAVIPGTEFAWDGDNDDASYDDGGWGGLFWFFILIVIVVIICGYVWSSPGTMQDKTDATKTTSMIDVDSPERLVFEETRTRVRHL